MEKTASVRSVIFWPLVVLVAMLALAVRVHQLGFDSMFMDETRQASYYAYSFWEIVQLAASQTQPPMDYWIGRLFYIFSPGDFSVRLPSALFGTATVSLLSGLLMRRLGIGIGLVVGICLAFNPFFVYYAQEARPYASATFFCLLFVALFYRVLNNESQSRTDFFLVFLVSLFFILTRTLVPLIVILVALGVCVVSLLMDKGRSPDEARSKRTLALILCAVVVLYLPLFFYIYQQNTRFLGDWGIANRMQSILTGMSLDNVWRIVSVQAGHSAGLLITFALVGIYAGWERARWLIVLIASVTALHFLVYLGTSPRPMRPPYAFYLLPFLVVLAAIGWKWTAGLISSGRLRFVLAGVLAVVFIASQTIDLYHFKSRKIRTDWKSLAAWARSEGDAKTMLLMESLSLSEHWYPGFTGFIRYDPGEVKLLSPEVMLKLIDQAKFSAWKPVLVLYYHRDYKIRPYDRFGVLAVSSDPVPILKADEIAPGIELVQFHGMSLIRPREYSGNLAVDLLRLFDGLHPDEFGGPAWVRIRTLAEILREPTPNQLREFVNGEREHARPSQQRFLDAVLEKF